MSGRSRANLSLPSRSPARSPGQSAANLKLVADFIDRLEEDSSFRRRFGEISFTGAAEAPLVSTDMNFRVTAKVAGGQPQ